MINQVNQTYYRMTRTPEQPVNAIYYQYNGIFEHVISEVMPFNLFSLKRTFSKEWKCDDKTKNIIYFDSYKDITNNQIDLVITNDDNELENLKSFCGSMCCPLILINHSLSEIDLKNGIIVDSYNNAYGFQTYNTPKKIDVLLCGDYSFEDQQIVKFMQHTYPDIISVGYNYNSIHYKTYDELMEYMMCSKICLCATSSWELPLLPLIAMSFGSVVITNKTKISSAIFKDNEDVLLFDDLEQIGPMINELMEDKNKVEKLRNNAYKLINNNFNIDKAKHNWLSIFNEAKDKVIKI